VAVAAAVQAAALRNNNYCPAVHPASAGPTDARQRPPHFLRRALFVY
jgi:hypothetical protein